MKEALKLRRPTLIWFIYLFFDLSRTFPSHRLYKVTTRPQQGTAFVGWPVKEPRRSAGKTNVRAPIWWDAGNSHLLTVNSSWLYRSVSKFTLICKLKENFEPPPVSDTSDPSFSSGLRPPRLPGCSALIHSILHLTVHFLPHVAKATSDLVCAAWSYTTSTQLLHWHHWLADLRTCIGSLWTLTSGQYTHSIVWCPLVAADALTFPRLHFDNLIDKMKKNEWLTCNMNVDLHQYYLDF